MNEKQIIKDFRKEIGLIWFSEPGTVESKIRETQNLFSDKIKLCSEAHNRELVVRATQHQDDVNNLVNDIQEKEKEIEELKGMVSGGYGEFKDLVGCELIKDHYEKKIKSMTERIENQKEELWSRVMALNTIKAMDSSNDLYVRLEDVLSHIKELRQTLTPQGKVGQGTSGGKA